MHNASTSLNLYIYEIKQSNFICPKYLRIKMGYFVNRKPGTAAGKHRKARFPGRYRVA